MSKKEHKNPETEETVNQQPEPDEAVAQTADMEQEETASEPSETDKMQELEPEFFLYLISGISYYG